METFRPDTWQDLARKAQGGDRKAYSRLLADISPYIRNVLIGHVADPEWIEDIAQEILISVHKSLRTYDPDKAFKPWLGAIIKFRRTDFLRKHYRARGDKQTSLETLDFQKEYVTKPEHWGELKDVEKALEALPKKQRKIFELMKIQGYTAQEVASQTGMSVSAVKVSSHRTIQKLKKALGR